MKIQVKRTAIAFLTAAMICIFSTSVFAASTRKCYTIVNGNTAVYSNTALTKRYGTIYKSDEITVISVTGKYSKVSYPVSGGRTKTGYISTGSILTGTTGNTYVAKAKITTYRRPGGSSYGYITSGDRVMVLGSYGSYTQVKYPVKGGYKYGFVTTDNANRYIKGKVDNYVNIPNGMYTVSTALKASMVMDVYDGRSANGTNIQIYQSNGGNNQKFNITAVGSGWYKIINVHTNKAVDVAGGVKAGNVNVQLYDYNGSDAQLWRFISAGNGYYYIQNKLGYYLDVYNNQTANETNILVYYFNKGNNQKWKLTTTNKKISTETYYVTTKAGLILRASKSVSSARKMTMPFGAAVTVYSNDGVWCDLSYKGVRGYASSRYLSKIKPAEGSTSGFKINGIGIGYNAGAYFTDNGKACTDHGVKGKHSYTNENACNCICTYKGKSLGAVQCFGFARYVQSRLYGSNSYSNPKRFYKLSNAYVRAGVLTSARLKSIIKRAKVGAHIRTNGSAHSMIITGITDSGFSIIQCNGSNNREYKGYYACRIGTYTYTWNSYVQSIYGKRGINYIEMAY